MASKDSSDSTNSIEQMSFTESTGIQETEYTQNSSTRTIVTVAEMPQETIIAQETMPPGVTVATDPGGQDNDDESRQKEICDSGETVTFKVIYNKQKYDLTFPMDKTVLNLKDHIKTLTGVPSSMQKLMYKGLAKDESTLRDLKVTSASKIMVVGSTMNDVLQVTRTPNVKELQEGEKAVASKEPLSQLKQHKLVIDKYGKPDDILPGIKGKREHLPRQPITGMYNKSGGKVRLTFKLELDQLWLGTKERTEKLPMNSIKAVVSEPIVGHEEYHMLALQLGPTEASRYWIYWVPAQYADAIKDTVMGKWQLF